MERNGSDVAGNRTRDRQSASLVVWSCNHSAILDALKKEIWHYIKNFEPLSYFNVMNSYYYIYYDNLFITRQLII